MESATNVLRDVGDLNTLSVSQRPRDCVVNLIDPEIVAF